MKVRQKLLSAHDEKIFNRYLFWWCVSIALVGFGTHAFNLQIKNYELLTLLGRVTPAIERWTVASDHEHAAKAIWIWMTYTAPLVIARLVFLIKRVNAFSPVLQILVFSALAYLATGAFIQGTMLSIDVSLPTTSERFLLYTRYLVGTIAISCIFGTLFVSSYTVTITCIIELLGLRKPKPEAAA